MMKETEEQNRIYQTLKSDKKILSIYFTAGFPELDDTRTILRELQEHGADLVEIGLPFSDPLADGPTIQDSSTKALENGMSTSKLFEQLQGVREEIHIPLIIMGYFNPVLQFGVEKFCQQCSEIGIDGLILPDLPLEEYQRHYREVFEKYGLSLIFLITPQTSEERIRQLDKASGGFLYMVSTASTTGSGRGFGHGELEYFKRIASMKLDNPTITGFGIKDRETFRQATEYASGAIIGSAFIRHLEKEGPSRTGQFLKRIR